MAAYTTRKPILFAVVFLAVSAARAWADVPINTLVSFVGPNGSNPYGGMVLLGSTLYGTTSQGGQGSGGSGGYGTVFSISLTTGVPSVLASFDGTNGNMPYAGLTPSADGTVLYGTTQYGGSGGYGNVFSVPISGGGPRLLASFNGTNGYVPTAGLTLSADGTTLYGTTQSGGTNGYGNIFSVPVSGGTPTNLVSFNWTDGANPSARLTRSGNMLYGTTLGGGDFGYGTVFSVPVSGGTPTILASFDYTNGAYPSGGLTLIGNTLFGATQDGGTSGFGGVFSVPITGGTGAVLASFDGSIGNPNADLTLSADGTTFYGTIPYGGINGYGGVFSVPVAGGTPMELASFSGPDGENPYAGLTLSADGTTLYGTTAYGGASATGNGTVFSITLPVPEPAGLAVVALGAVGLLTKRKRTERR